MSGVEPTYTVEWMRPNAPDGEQDIQRCTGLTPRQALARLIGALKNSGTIAVVSVTREVAEQ